MQGVHSAVAQRVLRPQGVAALPVRVLHDAISAGVYTAVRGLGGALGFVGTAAAVAGSGHPSRPPLAASPGGAIAISALNGAVGDRLELEASALSISMRFMPPPPEPMNAPSGSPVTALYR